MKRGVNLGSIGAGIEMDEVRELHNELWTVVDGYDGGGGEGAMGECDGVEGGDE